MLPYKTLILISEESPVPYYKQICNQLIVLIRQGRLQAGNPIPGSRELASMLGVHRNTVIAAYEELSAQNWIETAARKGTRISAHLPLIKPKVFHQEIRPSSYSGPAKFSFSKLPDTKKPIFQGTHKQVLMVNDGFPDADLAPFDAILKLYRKQLGSKKIKQLLSHGDAGGTPGLRTAGCSFLNETRGLNISEENLMITRGAQMAIYLAASLILKPGDQVLVSDPNYYIADQVFAAMGAKLLRVPVDEEGMRVDAIEAILRTTKVSLLYVIPHHHHPTTVTMGTARRIKLMQLIHQYGIPVIEDDYDYDFHYQNSPVLPLASGDHGGNVIYIGSYTKLLASSFRLGYLVAGANFIRQAVNLRKIIDLKGDALMEEALAEMINNGELGRHIKRSVKLYSSRCDLVCRLLKEELGHALDFVKPQGGLAVWLRFKPAFPLDEVLTKTAAKGLLLFGSAYYLEEERQYNALRFGFASLNEAEIERAVGILRECTLLYCKGSRSQSVF